MPTEFTYTDTINGKRPAQDVVELFRRRFRYFQYHGPGDLIDPEMPAAGASQNTWGIPPRAMFPVDAFDYVAASFKRHIGAPLTYRHPSEQELLTPDAKYTLLVILAAHFFWFTTTEGALWLLEFYGVQELKPHHGYKYFYLDPRTNLGTELCDASGFSLRIFERCERHRDPPIASQSSSLIERMKEILTKLRSPYAPASDPILFPQGGMWHLISEAITKWLDEPRTNLELLDAKPGRMSGPQWARSVKRDEVNLRYPALEQIEVFKSRCYRIEDKAGGIVWVGANSVSHPPLTDFHRRMGTLPEQEILSTFRCSSCAHVRSCVQMAGNGLRYCTHCVGAFLQKGDRKELFKCMMKECKACPDYLADTVDYVNLVSRLNRGDPTRVSR